MGVLVKLAFHWSSGEAPPGMPEKQVTILTPLRENPHRPSLTGVPAVQAMPQGGKPGHKSAYCCDHVNSEAYVIAPNVVSTMEIKPTSALFSSPF